MTVQIAQILEQWYLDRDISQWVLGTVYETEGTCYCDVGAMILFDARNRQFGALQTGLLAVEIHQQVNQVLKTGKTKTLQCYSSVSGLSLQSQTGAGIVHIQLQVINQGNEYLHLHHLRSSLIERNRGVYSLRIGEGSGLDQSHFVNHDMFTRGPPMAQAQLTLDGEQQWLSIPVKPSPHLLVVGGGFGCSLTDEYGCGYRLVSYSV